jgi:hypothetical protein
MLHYEFCPLSIAISGKRIFLSLAVEETEMNGREKEKYVYRLVPSLVFSFFLV